MDTYEIVIFVLLNLKKWSAVSIIVDTLLYICYISDIMVMLFELSYLMVSLFLLKFTLWVLLPPKLSVKCVCRHEVISLAAVLNLLWHLSCLTVCAWRHAAEHPGGRVFASCIQPRWVWSCSQAWTKPLTSIQPPAPLLLFLAHTCSAEPAAEPQRSGQPLNILSITRGAAF